MNFLDVPPTYHSLYEQITSPVNEVNNQIRRAIGDGESADTCCNCCSMCCRLSSSLLLKSYEVSYKSSFFKL